MSSEIHSYVQCAVLMPNLSYLSFGGRLVTSRQPLGDFGMLTRKLVTARSCRCRS